MKRFLTVVCFCVGLNARGEESLSTNEIAGPRPVYRYLLVVDTSSSMSRQKAITTDTIGKLILSGISGRIRTNEAWSIWTFDDRLHTNVFPAQMWDPRRRGEAANRAYRFLRDQRFKKKKGRLDKTLAAIAAEAEFSNALTVFLFTDGTEPMKGTPFDEPISAIFTQHAAGMRKAKKPFVTVLVAQDGRFVAHAVSPGGESIYVPRLARKPENATNAAPAQPGAGTKPEPTATAQPPQKRTLTVEEVSEALRQSRKTQTNTVAAAPAPLIIRGETSTHPAAPAEVSKPNLETPAPVPGPTSPAPETAAVQKRSVAVSNIAPPAIAPTAPAGIGSNAPVGKNIPARAEAIVPPAPPKKEDAKAAAETATDKAEETPAFSSAPPQTAGLLQPAPASQAWKYLVAAGALLLAALVLAWLYLRTIRYVPRPSIISQSLDKERK